MTIAVTKIDELTIAVSVSQLTKGVRRKDKGVIMGNVGPAGTKIQLIFTPANFESLNLAVLSSFTLETFVIDDTLSFTKNVDLPDGTIQAIISTYDISTSAGASLFYMPNEY